LDILDRLEHDVRICFPHDEKYDPTKIYMKLEDWEPDPCTIVEIEEELADFTKQF
jgi:hypothetical protein